MSDISLMNELDAAFRSVQRLVRDIEKDGKPTSAEVLMIVSLEPGDPKEKVVLIPNTMTPDQAALELQQTIEIVSKGKQRDPRAEV